MWECVKRARTDSRKDFKACLFTTQCKVSLPPFQWPWEDPRYLWACPFWEPSLERTWNMGEEEEEGQKKKRCLVSQLQMSDKVIHDGLRWLIHTWVVGWTCGAWPGRKSFRWWTRSSCVWWRFSPRPSCVCARWGDRCCVFCPGLWEASWHPGF